MKDNPNKFILLRLYHNQTNKANKLNINALIFPSKPSTERCTLRSHIPCLFVWL